MLSFLLIHCFKHLRSIFNLHESTTQTSSVHLRYYYFYRFLSCLGISFLLLPHVEYDCPSIEYIFDSVKNNFPDEFEGKTIAHGPGKDRPDATHQCPYTWSTQGTFICLQNVSRFYASLWNKAYAWWIRYSWLENATLACSYN